MKGIRNGVAAKISVQQLKALYIHCLNHSLNLAACDTIKLLKILNESLSYCFEIIKLIKDSPKKEALLRKIKEDHLDTSVVIRTFYPTCWTIKNEALWGIIVNYLFLIECFEELENIKPDQKARITGVVSVIK